MFKTIESIKNETIKKYLRLSLSKKFRNEQGLCVLEGLRLVTDSYKFGANFKHILISKQILKKIRLNKSPLLNFHEYVLIDENVAKKISSVKNNQGIFAIVKKPRIFNFSEIATSKQVLILVKVRDPGNIGTLIRSAVAFDFNTIVLVDCCDFCNPKTIRSSMGAVFKPKILKCSIEILKTWLKQTKLETIAAVSNQINKNQLAKEKFLGCALLIGNEANGLPIEIINFCKTKKTIAMQNEIESLNAAIAGSILMFELSKKLFND